MYNDYALGGWLEWKHRNVVPTVDGMTDAYEVNHIASYVNASSAGQGWLDFISSTNAQYALLTTGSPLALALEERPEWQPQVSDSNYTLLKRLARVPNLVEGQGTRCRLSRSRVMSDAARARLEPHMPGASAKGGRWWSSVPGSSAVMEGIIWWIRTRSPFRDLPEEFGPRQTARKRHRRVQR